MMHSMSSSAYVLIAASNDARGKALIPITEGLGFKSKATSDPKALLLQVQKSAPTLLILEDKFIEGVTQLDFVNVLRRRDNLVQVPFICLGSSNARRQADLITKGVDLYITMPTRSDLLKAYIKRYLDRENHQRELRNVLGQLRHNEAEWKKSEQIKEDLTHMLIHDLKSPIAAVIGLLDHSIEMLSGETKVDRKDMREILELAQGEANHLLNLSSNILDVRRMREGYMPYYPKPIDNLETLARQSLQDATAVKERHYDFLVSTDIGEFQADPDLLRRIIANLFSNAVKHTRVNGRIDFRAQKGDNELIISVRDDGEGIPEADQRRIFNVFEQSLSGTRTRYDTGIGLTFCKMAVEKHGGKIWVESKIGTGSTFFFTIPSDAGFDDEIIVG